MLIVLLELFVSPVGGALLGYVGDDSMNQLRQLRGKPTEDNMVLWLVLGIIIPIITLALMQNSINQMLDDATV